MALTGIVPDTVTVSPFAVAPRPGTAFIVTVFNEYSAKQGPDGFDAILSTIDWAVKVLLIFQEACPAVTPLYRTAIVCPLAPVAPISKEKEACTSPKLRNAS